MRHPVPTSCISTLASVPLVLLAGMAQAATHTVCASGCDYTSIQAAADAASSGDTLELEPETFVEGDIDLSKDLTITTSSGRATIDGDGELTVFDIDSAAVVFLEDLTVKNATRAMLTNSGVLYLDTVYVNGDGSTATIYGGIVNYSSGYLVMRASSVVQNNISTSVGGGISNFGDLEIRNSTLIGNEGRLGGGIYNSQGDVSVSGSSISGNHATVRGGGYSNAHVGGGAVVIHGSTSYSSNTSGIDCDVYYDIHRSPSCRN
ncbi:MAG: hypothetical protein MI919_08190 [Holophagales bacterium]|nr:hypothetical protein [Holophagales bacterium]